MIRDRLVVGIVDKKTSEQLQMDAALTLQRAKKTIWQKEAIREQDQSLEQEAKNSITLEERWVVDHSRPNEEESMASKVWFQRWGAAVAGYDNHNKGREMSSNGSCLPQMQRQRAFQCNMFHEVSPTRQYRLHIFGWAKQQGPNKLEGYASYW